MTVTSSLKDKGYKLTRVIPVGLIPADFMEQPQAESNADIKVENLQWVIIAESEQQKQHELLVFVFKDDASANIFWGQIPAMISEAFAPAEHTCMYRTDYSTGKTYCPYCVEQPAFEIEESENTIRIFTFYAFWDFPPQYIRYGARARANASASARHCAESAESPLPAARASQISSVPMRARETVW